MTQADSVHSTPRLNAPVDPTRRSFLSTAAGVAASGAVLTLATVSATADAVAPMAAAAASNVDPIFALIAKHRAEEQAYSAALMARDELDAGPEAYDLVEQLCVSCFELEWELASTMPTSIAGVAAVLRYGNEVEDQGEEWPDTDTIGAEGWHYQLRQSAARALETLQAEEMA
jgi:hypothetical protein